MNGATTNARTGNLAGLLTGAGFSVVFGLVALIFMGLLLNGSASQKLTTLQNSVAKLNTDTLALEARVPALLECDALLQTNVSALATCQDQAAARCANTTTQIQDQITTINSLLISTLNTTLVTLVNQTCERALALQAAIAEAAANASYAQAAYIQNGTVRVALSGSDAFQSVAYAVRELSVGPFRITYLDVDVWPTPLVYAANGVVNASLVYSDFAPPLQSLNVACGTARPLLSVQSARFGWNTLVPGARATQYQWECASEARLVLATQSTLGVGDTVRQEARVTLIGQFL